MTTPNISKTITLGDLVLDDLNIMPRFAAGDGIEKYTLKDPNTLLSVEMKVINGNVVIKNSVGDVVGHHPGYMGTEYIKITRIQEGNHSRFGVNHYDGGIYELLKGVMPNTGIEIKEKKAFHNGAMHYFFSHEQHDSLYYRVVVGNGSVTLSVYLKTKSENDEDGIIPYRWDEHSPVLLKSIVDGIAEIMGTGGSSSKKKTRRIEVRTR